MLKISLRKVYRNGSNANKLPGVVVVVVAVVT